jgi:transcriptional regulator with XRE-family HTH domain
MTAGLTQTELASVVGMSSSEVSRIELGQSPHVAYASLALLAAALGLDLPLRAFPDGDAVRDAAQLALLTRFRVRLPGLQHVAEVPLGLVGDRRAWDEVAFGRGWSIAVEAESRLRDLQALQRRLALKLRDGRRDRLILLVADSRHNRHVLRLAGDSIAAAYPVPAREAIAALEFGRCPAGSAVIVL